MLVKVQFGLLDYFASGDRPGQAWIVKSTGFASSEFDSQTDLADSLVAGRGYLLSVRVTGSQLKIARYFHARRESNGRPVTAVQALVGPAHTSIGLHAANMLFSPESPISYPPGRNVVGSRHEPAVFDVEPLDSATETRSRLLVVVDGPNEAQARVAARLLRAAGNLTDGSRWDLAVIADRDATAEFPGFDPIDRIEDHLGSPPEPQIEVGQAERSFAPLPTPRDPSTEHPDSVEADSPVDSAADPVVGDDSCASAEVAATESSACQVQPSGPEILYGEVPTYETYRRRIEHAISRPPFRLVPWRRAKLPDRYEHRRVFAAITDLVETIRRTEVSDHDLTIRIVLVQALMQMHLAHLEGREADYKEKVRTTLTWGTSPALAASIEWACEVGANYDESVKRYLARFTGLLAEGLLLRDLLDKPSETDGNPQSRKASDT